MKKFILFFLIIGALVAAVYFGFDWWKGKQEVKIAQLEEKIHFLKEETVPIRFKIIEKDADQITFLIKFYDQDSDDAFNLDTIQLPGQELSFDFYVVPVQDTAGREVKIAFPVKIFTNKIPAKDGRLLFSYYDDKGFPQVFGNSKADTAYVNRMSELFTKIKNKDTEEIEGIFGSMVQDIKQLNEFAVGKKYEIIVHSKGGIEIKEFI